MNNANNNIAFQVILKAGDVKSVTMLPQDSIIVYGLVKVARHSLSEVCKVPY